MAADLSTSAGDWQDKNPKRAAGPIILHRAGSGLHAYGHYGMTSD